MRQDRENPISQGGTGKTPDENILWQSNVKIQENGGELEDVPGAVPHSEGQDEYRSPKDGCVEEQEVCDDCSEDDPERGESAGRRTWVTLLLRMVALVTLAAFLILVVSTAWPRFPFPLELVSKSQQLARDIDVERLREAVVKIEVVSRRDGFPLKADQKSGTGFNIRPDGLIVTNHHVLDGALNILITFPDGRVQRAVNWTSRPDLDLAVIKLQGEGLPVVSVTNDGMPGQGDPIRVLGNPLGLNNIVVEGRVDRFLRVGDRSNIVFSIDAPVYPGNSGSPVFNRDGEVVGVVFARYEAEVEGEKKVFGLAIPVEEVLRMAGK